LNQSADVRSSAEYDRLLSELAACQDRIRELEAAHAREAVHWADIEFTQFPPELSESLSGIVENPLLGYDSKFRRAFQTIAAYYDSRMAVKSSPASFNVDNRFLEKLSATILNRSIPGAQILQSAELQEEMLSAVTTPDPQIAELGETIKAQKKRIKRQTKELHRLRHDIRELDQYIQATYDNEPPHVEFEEDFRHINPPIDDYDKSTDLWARLRRLEEDNARLRDALKTERSNVAEKLAGPQTTEYPEYDTLATYLTARGRTQKKRIEILRDQQTTRSYRK
jgi:uncharacterized coiled-coil protein SlyX